MLVFVRMLLVTIITQFLSHWMTIDYKIYPYINDLELEPHVVFWMAKEEQYSSAQV